MATVSKFTLNPLATCFIPSSMKYLNMTSTTFSVPSYEPFINEHARAKNVQLTITANEQNTGLKVRGAQSNPMKKNFIDLSVANKEAQTHSCVVEEDDVFEEPFTAEPIISTMNEMSEKETPVKSDDEKSSEQNDAGSEDTIDSKNTILTKLDLSLPNQTVISKISKFLKGGTKPLWMLLPFAVRSMLVMEFFYRMGLRTISLNMAMKTSSHLSSVLKPNFNTVTCIKKAKRTKIKEWRTKRDECHCPPMFGWIVPFGYFGNPFKLPETCEKDYVHTSYVDENSKQHQPEHFESFESNINDEKITLEQCSSELKAVIKDVCDSISSHDEDHPIPKSRKHPVWGTKTAKEIEKENSSLDIIDDGIHPLLQESQEVDSEDAEIPKIQAFLGEAFSLHKNSSGKILPSLSVCNLPCSVWCNKVPPPAKDAYKRFIRNIDSESTVSSKVADVKKKVLKKPLYKRCFSADDTPKSCDKIPFLSASSFESKERLLLLHKDPISFIKQSRTSALKDLSHTSRSKYSVAADQVTTKDNSNHSNLDKWSLYDGADSMWQPLPECIPSSDVTQKHFHRKARDVRRQKSVC